jgi:DNA-binding transcriptional ArsR family regulator
MSELQMDDFEIYYTKNGLVHVSNDIRRAVLSELNGRDLSLTDLSRALGKAQSTLSVHLDRMVEGGLIASYEDANDSRKKMYTLDSVRFAYSKKPDKRSMDALMRSLSDVASDPSRTRDAMIRLFLLGLDAVGLAVEPISLILGNIHAMALGGSLSGPTVEETVSNARRYYAGMGVGEINVYALNPLTLVLKDDMALSEDSAKSFGGYAAGFLIKVLEDATGNSYEMTSGETFGEDRNYYKFVLEPSRRRSAPRLERQQGPVPEDLASAQLQPYAAL